VVGEKAVVTDANESRRKNVQQEAAKELVDVQGEQLLGVAMGMVAIAEAVTRSPSKEMIRELLMAMRWV